MNDKKYFPLTATVGGHVRRGMFHPTAQSAHKASLGNPLYLGVVEVDAEIDGKANTQHFPTRIISKNEL